MVHPIRPAPSNTPPRTEEQQRHYNAGYASGEFHGRWDGSVAATVITVLLFAAMTAAFFIGRWLA